jgi:carboxymethylenebutenolidase
MTLIEIEAAEGTAQAWLSRPAETEPARPGVLMFIDAFGLRPRIYEMADRIAGWGYVVLAPNVFYRNGTVEDVAPKVDLTLPEERQKVFAEIRPRIDALTAERVLPDIACYVSALQAQEGVAAGPVAVVGYCMGARLAVRAAGAHPDDVAAVGGFHGGGLVTDAPDSPHRALATARAEFAFGHADQDPSMSPEAVEALGKALADAGLVAINEVYPGAPHGYTMSDTAMYDETAAERHFSALRELLGRRLPG